MNNEAQTSTKWYFVALFFICSVAVGVSCITDRYIFPDHTVLRHYDSITKTATKPVSEVNFVDRFVKYKEGQKYRPLANTIYVLKYYVIRNFNSYFGVFVNILVTFFAALVIFLLAVQAKAKASIAFAASSAFVLAPVSINQAWLHVITEDNLIIALSGASCLFYSYWKEFGGRKWFILTCIFMLVGPYYKEPVIASTIAIFVCELLSSRQKLGSTLLLGLIAANSWVPAFSINLLLFGEVASKASTAYAHAASPYFAMAHHLVGQLPLTPVFLLLLTLTWLVYKRNSFSDFFTDSPSWALKIVTKVRDKISDKFTPLKNNWHYLFLLFLILVIWYFFYSPYNISQALATGSIRRLPWYPKEFPSFLFFSSIFLLIGFTTLVASFPLRVVSIWFLATFYGMAKYYFIDHHMMYVLPSFVVILAAWGTYAFTKLQESSFKPYYPKLAKIIVVIVALELLTNLVNSVIIREDISKAENKLIEELQSYYPVNVLTNSMIGSDLEMLSIGTCNGPDYSYISKGQMLPDQPRKACFHNIRSAYSVWYTGFHNAIWGPQIKTIDDLIELKSDEMKTLILLDSIDSQWPFWPTDKPTPQSRGIAKEKVLDVEFNRKLYYVDPLRNLYSTFFMPRFVPPDLYREIIIKKPRPFQVQMQLHIEGHLVSSVEKTEEEKEFKE